MLTISSPAEPGSVDELAQAMHPDDADELAAAGVSVADALAGQSLSALRWSGRLVALFGCVQQPAGAGVPWMLCTSALQDVPRQAMAAISAHVVANWMGVHTVLQNMVHRRNARALRFVRWLGFQVHPEPVGPGGEFFLFSWRRDV